MESVRDMFNRVRSEDRLSIGDAEARGILQAYGLRIPRSEVAETPEQAIEIASELGYPVVLKIASPDILHKTDVGGVKVGLSNAEDVRDAFELMMYRAQRYVPEARLWGCLVQEMVPSGGIEVLVGMNRDPQFGPLVTFGLGGIYVEALKDVTFRVAPFSQLVLDFPEIVELDINPLIVYQQNQGAIAIDMRLILKEELA
jgi:acetyltransferase